MAKRPLEFAYGNRVNVPGKKGVQGVISAPRSAADMVCNVVFDPDLPQVIHFVRWMHDDGTPMADWFLASDIRDANEPASATAIVNELADAIQAATPKPTPGRWIVKRVTTPGPLKVGDRIVATMPKRRRHPVRKAAKKSRRPSKR